MMPDRVFGHALEAPAPALQVGARARDQVAGVDRLAGLGVGHQTRRAVLVLDVEDLGQRVRRACERGVRRHVAHALAVDPELARVAQSP